MQKSRSENSETRFWAKFDMSKVSELLLPLKLPVTINTLALDLFTFSSKNGNRASIGNAI